MMSAPREAQTLSASLALQSESCVERRPISGDDDALGTPGDIDYFPQRCVWGGKAVHHRLNHVGDSFEVPPQEMIFR